MNSKTLTLSKEDVAKGYVITKCKCCDHEHKAHGMSNATAYSLTPGYGCHKCLGIRPES